MIKDIFKSLNSIHRDSNLTLEEKHLLIILIKYHNVEEGYSYPTYENLLEECSTNRRSKISKIIKGLKAKGYIEVVKVKGNKSHYYIKKHLFFLESIDSNKNQDSTKALVGEISVEEKSKNEENTIKSIIVSDFKESGLQMTIDDVEEVKVKQHPNNSRIAKETNIKLTPFYCEAFSHVDETVLEMALREKAKTATLLLKKCIRLSKQIGLEFAKEFINKVLKFKDYKDEYDLASENNEVYVDYIERKVSLGLI
jgi:hypothetical protein